MSPSGPACKCHSTTASTEKGCTRKVSIAATLRCMKAAHARHRQSGCRNENTLLKLPQDVPLGRDRGHGGDFVQRKHVNCLCAAKTTIYAFILLAKRAMEVLLS